LTLLLTASEERVVGGMEGRNRRGTAALEIGE
jgi:hypothetical protein